MRWREASYERVAGIDLHKKADDGSPYESRVNSPGSTATRSAGYRTFYSALREMTASLVEQQVTHVAMESTGTYWRPVFHVLAEANSLEMLLCNAPSRPCRL
jgi:transposase